MGTSNFGTPKYGLPLVAGCMFSVMEEAWNKDKDLVEEYGEYDYGQYQFDCDCVIDELEHKIEELGLEFFKVEIEPGYYDGFWLDANMVGLPYEADYVSELEDEEIDDYFGKTRKELEEAVEAERGKIEGFLLGLPEPSFMHLAVAARFSNGETWYTKA